MNFDAIVIGSGVGGLTTAAALSQAGKRVMVLEQHNRLGGYLHSFQRKHWEWNVGLHFMPNIQNSGQLNAMFHNLTGNRVELQPFPDKTFILEYPGNKFEFISDGEALKQRIADAFPHEKVSLEKFWSRIERIGKRTQALLRPGFFSPHVSPFVHFLVTLPFFKLRKSTVQQVIDESFSDPELKNFFYYYTTETGVAPNRGSFLFYAMVKSSFLAGYRYPKGGGKAIVDALIRTIEDNGGAFRTNFEVDKVIVKNRRAVGVISKEGEQISARSVISGIGVQETFSRLISPHHVNGNYIQNIKRHETTDSMITLFVGLKGDISKVGAEAGNYRIHSGAPFEQGNSDPTAEDWYPDSAMIMFPSLIDADQHRDNLHTCEVLVKCNYAHFTKWASQSSKARDEMYHALKRALESKLLNVLTHRFPGIEAYIQFYELGTPVTYEHYCRRQNGAFLGMEVTPDKFNDQRLHAVSPIKNLYLTGSDITTCGVIGAFMSGVITATHVADRRLLHQLTREPC